MANAPSRLWRCATRTAHFFDLGGPSHYSGNYPIGFEHCGAHFFDLGGPSHYSGNYPIGFEHCDAGTASGEDINAPRSWLTA